MSRDEAYTSAHGARTSHLVPDEGFDLVCRDHVLAELRAYAPLVTPGQYLIVADTVVGHLDEHRAPKNRSKVWYRGNEPLAALGAFLSETDRFEVDQAITGKLILSSSPGTPRN